MGEGGSFLMELLKIASGNQIRSIKILSVASIDLRTTENSDLSKELPKLKTEELTLAMFLFFFLTVIFVSENVSESST